MAAEELWKRINEVAKKTAESSGGSGNQSPPPEASQTTGSPNESAQTATAPEMMFAAKERIDDLARKLKGKIPEAAKRIVTSEEDLPQDERVLSIIESLIAVDETKLSDPEYMRIIGERLTGVILDTGLTSATGQEADKYLRRIIRDHPGLEYLNKYKEMPVISGGSGAPREEGEGDAGNEPKTEEYKAELDRLYNEGVIEPLNDTPFAQELKSLKYRLEVDPNAVYSDDKLLGDAIKRIVETGEKENIDPELVKAAVDRIRKFEQYATVKYYENREKQSGEKLVRWGEIKGKVPNPGLHRDDEVFGDFRYLPADDVKLIISGEEGEAQWYFNFIDQIYSLGREETRPTLTQDQRFQAFKDYLVWKYGTEYHLAVQLYQKHWDSRGQYEYAVKGLMYNPGDVKDRLKAMSLLQGADLDHLYKNFDHSNEAYSLYEHVMFEVMAEKRGKYGEALKYLREKINWKGKFMAREDILKDLKEKQRKEGFDAKTGKKTETPLSVADQRLMHEIQKEMDLASEGVMLWDDDVQSYTELHITLSKLRNKREELLKMKSEGKALNESEQEQLHEVDRLYQIYAHRDEMLNENFTQELVQTRGLSPVDIEVRKRLIEYLKVQTGKEPAEYEIRMALWAARTAMIGSGRMAMIGAMMSIPPMSGGYKAASGKDVMRSPAFEDLQRIFNPEVFATRFNIGGEMGVTARGILRRNLLRTKGLSMKDPGWFKKISGALEGKGNKFRLTKTKEWMETKGGHDIDARQKEQMETWEFAEDATGISFSELLGPGFMASGGFYDGTTWRLEKGVADELRSKMLDMKKLPENAALLDNMALSIQLNLADNAAQRRPILDRMLRRNPSKFLELLEEDTEKILFKHNIAHEEWMKFKEALSLAELKMAHEKEWQFARVDLAEKKDFEALVAPYLTMLHIDPIRADLFRQIIAELQTEVYRPREVKASGGTFHNKMDAIAQLKMPLTMSLTDMDWKESNFYQLGNVAMHRRIRDVGQQMAARDAMLELMSNQDMLLSPNDPAESLKKIKEIREQIIGYSGPEAAENTAVQMMRMLIEMNRHRHLWTIGAVPGMTWLAKRVAEADLRGVKNSVLMWPLRKAMGDDRWEKLAGEKLAHWPHSVAEAISYSIRYTGYHGNAWDENKIEGVLNTAHDMGMFIHHPEYLQDMRKEFHATWNDRMLAIVRKYWWVIIVATFALAIEQSIEEQKGGGGGGGGGGHH